MSGEPSAFTWGRDGSSATPSSAAAATRVMTSFFFGVSPLDPLVFALIPLGLALVALFASYIPARRAAATDPLEALRSQ